MANSRRNITIRVSSSLWAALKEVARANDVTLTELCEGFLESGVRQRVRTPGMTYLMPEIRSLLETHLHQMEERFARLIARTAMEAGSAKRLVTHLLITSNINTEEEAKEAQQIAWRLTGKSINAPLESIEELLVSLRSEEER